MNPSPLVHLFIYEGTLLPLYLWLMVIFLLGRCLLYGSVWKEWKASWALRKETKRQDATQILRDFEVAAEAVQTPQHRHEDTAAAPRPTPYVSPQKQRQERQGPHIRDELHWHCDLDVTKHAETPAPIPGYNPRKFGPLPPARTPQGKEFRDQYAWKYEDPAPPSITIIQAPPMPSALSTAQIHAAIVTIASWQLAINQLIVEIDQSKANPNLVTAHCMSLSEYFLAILSDLRQLVPLYHGNLSFLAAQLQLPYDNMKLLYNWLRVVGQPALPQEIIAMLIQLEQIWSLFGQNILVQPAPMPITYTSPSPAYNSDAKKAAAGQPFSGLKLGSYAVTRDEPAPAPAPSPAPEPLPSAPTSTGNAFQVPSAPTKAPGTFGTSASRERPVEAQKDDDDKDARRKRGKRALSPPPKPAVVKAKDPHRRFRDNHRGREPY